MGNKERFVSDAERNVVLLEVLSATVIEKGDFIVLSGGKATTPSLLQASGGGATQVSRILAKSVTALAFVGIAIDASAAGETVPVAVDVSIESQYNLAQTTAAGISFGARLEIDAVSYASASFGCVDDTVVAGSTNPIAVCLRDHTSATVTTKSKLLPQKIINDVAGQS